VVVTLARGRGRPLLADVVRSELQRAILAGEFPLGAKLPNEEQLCQRFNVSRVTIREAVRGLIEDRYVVRRQGSGTYVTRRPLLLNSLDENFSYTEYIEGSGLKPGRKVLASRSTSADEETSEALGLESGSAVVEVRRIRTADGRPVIYSIDALPPDVADQARDQVALRGSLYRLLTAAGHPIGHAEAVVIPTIADKELASLLDVQLGTPLQHIKQVDFDVDGRPVMFSREWLAPSVIELRVIRRGPGPVA
jgi:GntR family transcriptional regulator